MPTNSNIPTQESLPDEEIFQMEHEITEMNTLLKKSLQTLHESASDQEDENTLAEIEHFFE